MGLSREKCPGPIYYPEDEALFIRYLPSSEVQDQNRGGHAKKKSPALISAALWGSS